MTAALEYWFGLKPGAYVMADIIEILTGALRRRSLPLDAAVGMRKVNPPATNGATPRHGRRRLDAAVLLLALLVDVEHLEPCSG